MRINWQRMFGEGTSIVEETYDFVYPYTYPCSPFHNRIRWKQYLLFLKKYSKGNDVVSIEFDKINKTSSKRVRTLAQKALRRY